MSEKMYKGYSFPFIIIQPQKSGGGHLILCPPPSKKWGDISPCPPRICAHGQTYITHIVWCRDTTNIYQMICIGIILNLSVASNNCLDF